MESLRPYMDWIYIIAVIVAFLVFILWNRKNNARIKDRKNRKFGSSLRQKKQRDDGPETK